MQFCENEPKIWSQFLNYAEEKCSATAFKNWLAPIKVLHESADGLTLEIPNIFVKEYLLDNYTKDLASFFPHGKEQNLPIEFVVSAPKKTPPKSHASCDSISKVETTKISLSLNQNYLFDNFVEGPSNQFVKSAAIGIAHRPSKTYNPLFIHGKVGLGKTHLLHAIGHSIQKSHRKLKVQCVTTESFINDLVDHLRNKSIASMKKFYRNLDILLIDDIQFLQNRLNFEEEFCNMFEALINQNKQIVITSDKPPSQLKLSERITARMEWGLVAQLAAPDLETRVAIIQHKAEQRNFTIPQTIAFYMAERLQQNIRQIEGAVNKLSAYCQILSVPLSEDVVIEVLGEMLQSPLSTQPNIDLILKQVCQLFNVKIADLKGTSRSQQIVLPRQVAMYLAKEYMSDSLSTIGSAFGKTHSTILHAHKTIATKSKTDSLLQEQIRELRAFL